MGDEEERRSDSGRPLKWECSEEEGSGDLSFPKNLSA